MPVAIFGHEIGVRVAIFGHEIKSKFLQKVNKKVTIIVTLGYVCAWVSHSVVCTLTPTIQTYVQHLLKENADKIVNQLIDERGHFYVCGDISMAADVCRTLQGIFEETAAMSSEHARKLIETMKDKGYYHEDIFGVTLKHQEVTTRVRTAAKK